MRLSILCFLILSSACSPVEKSESLLDARNYFFPENSYQAYVYVERVRAFGISIAETIKEQKDYNSSYQPPKNIDLIVSGLPLTTLNSVKNGQHGPELCTNNTSALCSYTINSEQTEYVADKNSPTICFSTLTELASNAHVHRIGICAGIQKLLPYYGMPCKIGDAPPPFEGANCYENKWVCYKQFENNIWDPLTGKCVKLEPNYCGTLAGHAMPSCSTDFKCMKAFDSPKTKDGGLCSFGAPGELCEPNAPCMQGGTCLPMLTKEKTGFPVKPNFGICSGNRPYYKTGNACGFMDSGPVFGGCANNNKCMLINLPGGGEEWAGWCSDGSSGTECFSGPGSICQNDLHCLGQEKEFEPTAGLCLNNSTDANLSDKVLSCNESPDPVNCKKILGET